MLLAPPHGSWFCPLLQSPPPPQSAANPGVRIGEWIYANVAALFTPVLAVVALYYLARRQFAQFISFACFAVLVSLFVYAGADFRYALLLWPTLAFASGAEDHGKRAEG